MQTLDLFSANTVIPKGVDVSVFRPEVITKELKLSALPSGHKRIRLSSNFLPLMGFAPGMRTTVEDLGVNQGLRINFNPSGSTKIYQRTYTQRRNNPLEAQIDIQNQALIDRGIPSESERLHFTLRNGSILIKPLFNNTFLIRSAIKKASSPLNAFVALTGGVDAHCLQAAGFTIQSILEYRPQEARDKNDLTETGALNAISNVCPKYLFNEDITKIDWSVVKLLTKQEDQLGVLHVSIQCEEHSNLKTGFLKKRSIENLDTSVDLVYDALRMVETTQPATVVIENVPGFATSAAGDLLRIKLRRWGYFVTDAILDAREHNGKTSRKRYYLVASVWPGFEMPAPVSQDNHSIWPLIERHLEDCRDITHTSTVHLGIETGRARIITKDSAFAPTVIKSQARQAKDSIFVEHEGSFFMPSEQLLRELNGIPSDFNLNSVSSTIASEIIGQSIEYPMHHKLMVALKEHIQVNA